MARENSRAAEVRASQRALGDEASKGLSGSVLSIPSPINSDVDQLLREVVSADQVDILGVLPWQCAARLIELEEIRRRAGEAVTHPATVRYFTPARDRVILYRHSGVLGTLVQRWLAGITGLRNWLLPSSNGPGAEDSLSIYEFDDIYLECLIGTRTGDRIEVTAVTQLPIAKNSPAPESVDEATLVITQMDERQALVFQRYLDQLVRSATPLAPRKIRCKARLGPENAELRYGDEFDPTVARLSSYGPPSPGDIEPIAVVAVCASTAQGPAVILKKRTRQNSRDDFDTLSLLSERVLAEDLSPVTLSGPLDPDPDRALDELWLRSGKPEPFVLPEDAFRSAAQRELFLCCGLDVKRERLDFRGTCLVDREDENTQLGFYVFRLDLHRSEEVDELKEAQRWNSDLVVVPFSELFGNRRRTSLNRLLRRRELWLRKAVFETPINK